MTDEAFEGWALLELMGHRTRPGYVKEVEMAGGKMLRVDIPAGDDTVTEFYGVSAVYSLRPATEEIVRDVAGKSYGADPRPIRPVDYRPSTQIAHDDGGSGSAADDEELEF